MEQATRKINEQHERIEELQRENAKLREELQQSEDRFRNIPDEIWSKADLVEMIHKALDERDDANKQNAALRADKERMDWLEECHGWPEYIDAEWHFGGEVFSSHRAAIDAARKEAKP